MDESSLLSKDIVNIFFKTKKQSSTNNKCGDCNRTSPLWTLVPYGLFICSDCAAKHRKMQHKVKSTLLDKWTIGELRRIHVGGNAYAHKLGNERDTSMKYNDTQWYITMIDKKVQESVDKQEEFYIQKEEEVVVVKKDIKETPLPKFGDTKVNDDSTNKNDSSTYKNGSNTYKNGSNTYKNDISTNKNDKSTYKNDNTNVMKPCIVKKKNTPTLVRHNKYNIKDGNTSRLGFMFEDKE